MLENSISISANSFYSDIRKSLYWRQMMYFRIVKTRYVL